MPGRPRARAQARYDRNADQGRRRRPGVLDGVPLCRDPRSASPPSCDRLVRHARRTGCRRHGNPERPCPRQMRAFSVRSSDAQLCRAGDRLLDRTEIAGLPKADIFCCPRTCTQREARANALRSAASHSVTSSSYSVVSVSSSGMGLHGQHVPGSLRFLRCAQDPDAFPAGSWWPARRAGVILHGTHAARTPHARSCS